MYISLNNVFLVFKNLIEITNLDTQGQGTLIDEGQLGRIGKDKLNSLCVTLCPVSAFQKAKRIRLWKSYEL